MKKYFILISFAFLFAFVPLTFSADNIPSFTPGKITPMKGSRLVSPDELDELFGQPTSTSSLAPGTVSISSGTIEVLQPDGTWVKASGNTIKDGDTVRTSKTSGAKGQSSYGGEITVGADSGFKIRMSGQNQGNQYYMYGWIELQFGSIKIKGWIKGGEIHTIEAIMTIRGTDFIATRDPIAKKTYVYLHEGLIDIDNLHGKKLTLQPGQTIVIDSDGQMTLGTLAEADWSKMVSDITPNETTPATEQDLFNSLVWPGFAVPVLVVLGVGILIYRKLKR